MQVTMLLDKDYCDLRRVRSRHKGGKKCRSQATRRARHDAHIGDATRKAMQLGPSGGAAAAAAAASELAAAAAAAAVAGNGATSAAATGPAGMTSDPPVGPDNDGEVAVLTAWIARLNATCVLAFELLPAFEELVQRTGNAAPVRDADRGLSSVPAAPVSTQHIEAEAARAAAAQQGPRLPRQRPYSELASSGSPAATATAAALLVSTLDGRPDDAHADAAAINAAMARWLQHKHSAHRLAPNIEADHHFGEERRNAHARNVDRMLGSAVGGRAMSCCATVPPSSWPSTRGRFPIIFALSRRSCHRRHPSRTRATSAATSSRRLTWSIGLFYSRLPDCDPTFHHIRQCGRP